MSDTPRTDAMSFEARQVGFRDTLDCTLADDTRILERENNALRAALKSSCDEERSLIISEGLPHTTCGLAEELQNENTQLRAQLAEAIKDKDKATADQNVLKQHLANALSYWHMRFNGKTPIYAAADLEGYVMADCYNAIGVKWPKNDTTSSETL